MTHSNAREERLQLIQLVVALILFVCALSVLCSRDNQMALAHAQRQQVEPAVAAAFELQPAVDEQASVNGASALTTPGVAND
ncbi:MAG TPA: hypothetical protein VHY56_13380 [Candidatus Binataceae bacterium]|nr:hypothetical protein [Candidatus Binataceae bacterium]